MATGTATPGLNRIIPGNPSGRYPAFLRLASASSYWPPSPPTRPRVRIPPTASLYHSTGQGSTQPNHPKVVLGIECVDSSHALQTEGVDLTASPALVGEWMVGAVTPILVKALGGFSAGPPTSYPARCLANYRAKDHICGEKPPRDYLFRSPARDLSGPQMGG